MTIVKRIYSGSSVQMLTVLDTIVTNAKEHQAEIQGTISTYTLEYLSDLEARIDRTTEAHFGKDAAYNLRKATTLLLGMQKEGLGDLSLFKLILEERFPKDKAFVSETLKDLGFTSYYRAAQTRSQESLVQLLAQFRQHMTPELKSKIVAVGAQPVLIDRIVAQGNALHDANVTQETFKDGKKDDNQETLTQFNDLYEEVISLAKIAARTFKDKASLKDKFNYSKHLKTLTGSASASTLAKKAKAEKALQSA